MNNFYNLKDTHFVDLEVDRDIDNATARLEELLGKKLYPGSPERLMLIGLMEVILTAINFIDDTGRMNLLKFSRGEYLEHLASLLDEYRVESQKAHCTMRFYLSTVLDYVNVIPANTRVKTHDGREFETLEPAEIAPGEIYKDVVVYSTEPGSNGNGVGIGRIQTLVDVFPFYQKCENITDTTGGMDVEDDESLREKAHESPEKLSTAGPDYAYAFWAKKADENIGDVEVWSPEPGEVNIVPLYKDGSIPSQEVLDRIKNDEINRKRRPLTDKVEVFAPTEVELNFTVKYWVNEHDVNSLSTIQESAQVALNEYIRWQSNRLGRDIIPDKLVERLIDAGVKRVELEGLEYTIVPKGSVVRIKSHTLAYQGLEEG